MPEIYRHEEYIDKILQNMIMYLSDLFIIYKGLTYDISE